MCELITKNYNHYLKYILINTIFLNQNKSRLTDIKLYVNTFNTFKYLREGKKKEEIRCVFPSVIGPLKRMQKRYTNIVLNIGIGDIIRVCFRTNIVYMFVHDINIYKNCDIKTVLSDTDFKKVIPDAEDIETSIKKYTDICYKKKLKKYNKFYYIFNIKLLPIFYL